MVMERVACGLHAPSPHKNNGPRRRSGELGQLRDEPDEQSGTSPSFQFFLS